MRTILFCLAVLVSFSGMTQNYLVTNGNPSGAGSFNQAVIDANSDGVPSTITFDLASIPSGIVVVDGTVILTENETTIDGDTDGDGDPDITIFKNIDGDLIEITGSQNTVKSLNLAIGVDQTSGNAAIKINGSSNNTILNCYIGTAQDGVTPTTFRFHRGIMIIDLAVDNTVGGGNPEDRNVISNSISDGVLIQNSADNNTIIGNSIGVDIAGVLSIPNDENGINIIDSQLTTIGASGDVRNVIAANAGFGIRAINSPQTVIVNNHIGVDINGNSALSNTGGGIVLRPGCNLSRIGDGAPANGNIIGANGNYGVLIDGSNQVSVLGNYLGLGRDGLTDLGNTGSGIQVEGTAEETSIGNATSDGRNVISGNTDGISIQATAGINITVTGNYIGTDAAGTGSVANINGIFCAADQVTIGDATPAGRNIISGNTGSGIQFQTADDNIVIGNYIGVDVNGTAALGNGSEGIWIISGRLNWIGGSLASEGNVISGNGIGINISGDDNRMQLNFIGTDATGLNAIPNTTGIRISGTATGNRVGGTSDATSNFISGNTGNGITLWANDNVINNNFIGIAADETTALPNGNHGIAINNNASDNVIVGADIAYNQGYGVDIQNAATAIKNRVPFTQIWSNVLGGINQEPGTQEDVFPPKITELNTTTVSGTAAPNASVYLFADSLNQGQLYLESTTADASGNWSFPIDTASLPDGLGFYNVLQDSAGNTSEFNAIWHGINSIGPKIYWSDPISFPAEDQINQSNLDGSSFQYYYSGFDPEVVMGMALDTINNMLFWTDDNSARIFCGRIGHTGFSGTAGPLVDESFTSPRSYKGIDLDVAGGKMYWASPWDNTIKRANLDGSSVETIITVNGAYDVALDLVNNKIYYTANDVDGTLWYANLDGTDPQEIVNNGPDGVMRGIAVDIGNGHIYYAYSGTTESYIDRRDLNGTNSFLINDTDVFDPRGLELDTKGQKLYYVNGTTEEIVRISTDGSNFEVLHTGTFTVNPRFIALDLRNGTTGTPVPPGPYIVINTNDSGTGSLREAMTFANLNPGPDQILFDIPDTDPGYTNTAGEETWTITLLSRLPDITDEVIMDGYTQPGQGPSRVIVDGGGSFKFFSIVSPGGKEYTINDIRFINANTSESGAAFNFSSAAAGDILRLNACIFEGNTSSAGDGGAIYLENAVTLFIRDTYFDNNSAEFGGGAISAVASGTINLENVEFKGNIVNLGSGGAIDIVGSHSLSISGSSFSGNSSLSGNGGAIYVGNSSHSITNTTFSGNTANEGGAIFLIGLSSGLSITSVTFFNNSATTGAADLHIQAGSATVSHTVLEEFFIGAFGDLTSNGYNFIIEDQATPYPAVSGDIVGPVGSPLDPQLGVLALNGGTTLNHAPLAGSPLLDNGNAADLTAFPKDQRGLLRVDGPEADIGAIELQVTPDLDKIYWSERSGRDINRSNIDGTKFENWTLNPSPDPNGVAVDTVNGIMYWTDANEGSVNYGQITPSGITDIQTIINLGDTPFTDIELDLTNGKVYWLSNGGAPGISRADLDGSNVEYNYLTGLEGPLGLALDLTAGRMYWSENDNSGGDNIPSVRYANLDGSGVTPFYSEGAVPGEDYLFIDLEIDPVTQELYWSAGNDGQTGNNKFYSASTTGAGAPNVFTTVRGQPGGFEVDWINGKIYFVDQGVVSAEPPTLWVMDLDGTNQVPLLEGVSEGIDTPKYLALGFPTVATGLPTITLIGPSEICVGDSTELQASAGDAYQWYQDGSPIAGATSQSYFATATGNYNVEVTIGASSSFAATDVAIFVGTAPSISAQPVDQDLCEGDSGSFAVSASGIDLVFQWEQDQGTGFDVLSDGGIYTGTNTPDLQLSDVSGLDGYRFRLVITEVGQPVACTTVSDTVNLTVTTPPTADAGTDQTICSTATVLLSGLIGGGAASSSWSSAGDGVFSDTTDLSSTYTPGVADSTAGSVELVLRTDDPPGSCIAAADTVIITLDPAPFVFAGVDQNICTGDIVQLDGSIGGNTVNPTWTTSGDGTFDDNTLPAATYTPGPGDLTSGSVSLILQAEPALGVCPPASDTLSLTIALPISSQPQSGNVEIGNSVQIDLLNGAFTNAGDILTFTITRDPQKGNITDLNNGILTYTPNQGTVGNDTIGFEICNQCNSCTSNLAVIGIANTPPVVNPPPIDVPSGTEISIDLSDFIIDLNDNIDTTSFRVISGPAAGALAYFEGTSLILDYSGSNFSGTDEVVIEVCDLSGVCVQALFSITVERDPVNIINALSPNGDGLHDFFEIENIQFYPDNQVQIFSRWGDRVYSATGYDNASIVFDGRASSGNLVPAGTYFYIIRIKPDPGTADQLELTGNLLIKY